MATRPPPRPAKPTQRGPHGDDGELTIPDRPMGRRAPPVEAPTLVDPPRPPAPFVATSAKDPADSQPLRVISMKTPVDREAAGAPKPHRMQLRELSQLRKHHATPPQGLGHLAPPRDERDARVRRRQDLLIWASVIVIVGSLVTLGIWFLAR